MFILHWILGKISIQIIEILWPKPFPTMANLDEPFRLPIEAVRYLIDIWLAHDHQHFEIGSGEVIIEIGMVDFAQT